MGLNKKGTPEPVFQDAILNGKKLVINHNTMNIPLKDFYIMQMTNQTHMLEKGMYDPHLTSGIEEIPGDYPNMVSYHILHLISELGEVLEADKRWKSHRKDKEDLEEKKDEVMDLIIIALNLAIYSEISPNELEIRLKNKMQVNRDRLNQNQLNQIRTT